jgi:hypothetical protein
MARLKYRKPGVAEMLQVALAPLLQMQPRRQEMPLTRISLLWKDAWSFREIAWFCSLWSTAQSREKTWGRESVAA